MAFVTIPGINKTTTSNSAVKGEKSNKERSIVASAAEQALSQPQRSQRIVGPSGIAYDGQGKPIVEAGIPLGNRVKKKEDLDLENHEVAPAPDAPVVVARDKPEEEEENPLEEGSGFNRSKDMLEAERVARGLVDQAVEIPQPAAAVVQGEVAQPVEAFVDDEVEGAAPSAAKQAVQETDEEEREELVQSRPLFAPERVVRPRAAADAAPPRQRDRADVIRQRDRGALYKLGNSLTVLAEALADQAGQQINSAVVREEVENILKIASKKPSVALALLNDERLGQIERSLERLQKAGRFKSVSRLFGIKNVAEQSLQKLCAFRKALDQATPNLHEEELITSQLTEAEAQARRIVTSRTMQVGESIQILREIKGILKTAFYYGYLSYAQQINRIIGLMRLGANKTVLPNIPKNGELNCKVFNLLEEIDSRNMFYQQGHFGLYPNER